MQISVAPLSEKTYDIPQKIQAEIDGAEVAAAAMNTRVPEYALTVSFVLR